MCDNASKQGNDDAAPKPTNKEEAITLATR